MKTIRPAVLLLILAMLASACVQVEIGTRPAPSPITSSPSSTPALSPSATNQGAASSVTPAPSSPASPAETARATGIPLPSTGAGLSFPIRAAFYYPWFPQAWSQGGVSPFTHYHPALGFYDSGDLAVIRKHIAAMQYGKIQLGIASWWGQGHHTDTHVPALLQAGEETGFYWALYMENEGQGNPTPESIRADLTYIRDKYAASPAYLKIDGRFVVFAYNDPSDTCDMAARWKQANTVGAYVVLKVVPGFRKCPDQPDGWHQYAPANAEESMGPDSYTISPGFFKATENQPRLERNLASWSAAIRAMIASKANFQLVTTFNEWGEGTAVEDAAEWSSPSGYGYYLDALHYDGNLPTSLFPYHAYFPAVMREGYIEERRIRTRI